jgi:hypothetical protein
MKPLTMKLTSAGLTNLCRLAVVACMAVALAVGCHKDSAQAVVASDQGIVPKDPQVVSNLVILNHELRQAMHQHRLTGNFDEFVAAAGVEVPPPPAGQKYSINKNWHIILVDANAK